MTYRVSYIDTSADAKDRRLFEGRPRDEYFPTEPAALARARELLDDIDCHTIIVRDGSGEPLRGVRLQLKVAVSTE